MWTITDEQIDNIEASSGCSAILPCEKLEVTSLDVGEVSKPAAPKILSAKWKEASTEKNEISVLKHKQKCFIEIKTEGFVNDDEVILEIKENIENSKALKTFNLKIKDNDAQTDSDDENALIAEEDWYGKQLIVTAISNKTDLFIGEKISIVCCAHAIKQGDEGDLIKELNIKLAGFGEKGNTIPGKKFTKETENAVKQFQRDYMKVAQTGIVCKYFLEKLDEFCDNYFIKIDSDSKFNIKCPCITRTATTYRCTTGFGRGQSGSLKYTHTYTDLAKEHELKEKIRTATSEEEKKKYETELANLPKLTKEINYVGVEKPGVHRSLLWAISSIAYYLDKIETDDNLGYHKFDSVYRCKGDNRDKFEVRISNDKKKNNITERTSSNHMGNAVDIHISQNGTRDSSKTDKNKVTIQPPVWRCI